MKTRIRNVLAALGLFLAYGVAMAAGGGELNQITADATSLHGPAKLLGGAVVILAVIGLLVAWVFHGVRGHSLARPAIAAVILIPFIAFVASRFV